MKRTLLLSVFGVLFLLALVGVILEAALYPTQWGLFVLFPYVLLPVTAAACATLGDSEEMSIYTNFGCFFESFFWVSAFAVPSLLYRVDAINQSQLWWLLSSDVLVFSSFNVCFVAVPE
uniref:Vacuolar protein sorting 55 n=1 Tax=Globisporangium ultimum (strain ATCC 200006 / CBS 805.95 / DAOM BR144) TaxID=431595 RepID=K3WEG6_GLOUD